MQGQRAILFPAATMMLALLASAPSAAAPMQALKSGYDTHVQGNVEQIARRCRYDKHGRLRCRGAHYRSYRRYYYNPYAYYGYYPRHWGFGHYNHHGFGHGHGHHHGHH
jgi:hypothetical protein